MHLIVFLKNINMRVKLANFSSLVLASPGVSLVWAGLQVPVGTSIGQDSCSHFFPWRGPMLFLAKSWNLADKNNLQITKQKGQKNPETAKKTEILPNN